MYFPKVVAKAVELVLSQISGDLREELIAVVNRLDVIAQASESPWDDILVDLAKAILGME